jgi:plastocyanin
VSHLIVATPPGRRLARGAAALAISVAFLTACGDDPSDTGAAPTTTAETSTETTGPTTGSGSATESGSADQTQSITATEADFSISLDEGSLAAGTYEIEVVNQGDATHDLVVERDGEDVEASDRIGPGESTTLTVTLESGEYVFYCSIGNHRSMGMETTVSVS